MLNCGWEQHCVVLLRGCQTCIPLPTYEKLTARHVYLDPALQMTNHLAEDVLHAKMLHLIKVRIFLVRQSVSLNNCPRQLHNKTTHSVFGQERSLFLQPNTPEKATSREK